MENIYGGQKTKGGPTQTTKERSDDEESDRSHDNNYLTFGNKINLVYEERDNLVTS